MHTLTCDHNIVLVHEFVVSWQWFLWRSKFLWLYISTPLSTVLPPSGIRSALVHIQAKSSYILHVCYFNIICCKSFTGIYSSPLVSQRYTFSSCQKSSTSLFCYNGIPSKGTRHTTQTTHQHRSLQHQRSGYSYGSPHQHWNTAECWSRFQDSSLRREISAHLEIQSRHVALEETSSRYRIPVVCTLSQHPIFPSCRGRHSPNVH